MPLPFGLNSFCWEITCWGYGVSFVCNCFVLLAELKILYCYFLPFYVCVLDSSCYALCVLSETDVYFPRLGKFSAWFFQVNFLFLSLSPFSVISIMWILLRLMMSFLNLVLLLFINLFSLCCSAWLLPITLSSRSLICFSVSF